MSVKTPGSVRFCDLERDLADRRPLLVHVFLERAADHQADDVGVAQVLDRVGRDLVAVAEDGDAVAERAHFLEPVRDEDDGAAFVAQAPRDAEERLDFAWASAARSARP